MSTDPRPDTFVGVQTVPIELYRDPPALDFVKNKIAIEALEAIGEDHHGITAIRRPEFSYLFGAIRGPEDEPYEVPTDEEHAEHVHIRCMIRFVQ